MDAHATCRSLILQGQYDRALAVVERALGADMHDPDLWNLKGVILRSAGRYMEADACFERSLRIEPRDGHS